MATGTSIGKRKKTTDLKFANGLNRTLREALDCKNYIFAVCFLSGFSFVVPLGGVDLEPGLLILELISKGIRSGPTQFLLIFKS
jgi:hypothetical protein